MSYLTKSEITDKIAFLNGMIDTHRNELNRSDNNYYVKRAKHFQDLADEYQAKADEMRQRHIDLIESRDETVAKINDYLSRRAKWVFIGSKRGKGIFDLLQKVKPQYHDRIIIAMMSAATSDNDIDLIALLKEIFE